MPLRGSKLTSAEEKTLNRLYSKGPSAYGSVKNLIAQSGLSVGKVKRFLHSKDSYTKYHNATRNFQRQHVYAKHINDIWCMDLAYVDKLKKENKGVTYLLVAVDVFSRFVRVQPLQNKSASTTLDAFKKFKCKPNQLWVDEGTEFGGVFKTFCKQNKISIYSTHSESKAAFAERAIRSLKRILYRFIEERQSYTYLFHLQDFVSTMNSRRNRSTGIAPKDVENSDAIIIHHKQQQHRRKQINKPPKYEVGDHVRIVKYDIKFRKGYKPQFTNEVFIISNISSRKPVATYDLHDLKGEEILGKFYEPELILIEQNE